MEDEVRPTGKFHFIVETRFFRPGQDYPAVPEDNYPV